MSLQRNDQTLVAGELLLEWTRKLISNGGTDKAFFFNIVETKVGNVESLFCFPKCSVSKGAEQLIEKINSLIEKNQIINATIAKYIRQTIVLYRVLITSVYGKTIEQFPQFSMILYNDCYRIAHELDVLCVKYKVDDDSKSSVSDVAASLRAFSATQRTEFINRELNVLKSYLEECKKFKDVYSNMKQYKKSIEKIIDHLDHLRRLWCQVVNQDNGIIMASIGEILEPIMNSICTYVLDINDIGENESQDICTLMTYFAKWISENIPNNNSDISKFIPSLFKFRAIKAMMVTSLLKITEDVKLGRDGSLYGLTSGELIKLTKAIFLDSEKRRGVIEQISQTKI